MAKIALFDLDGVLADDRHRVHFALKRDWNSYFAADLMAADGVWPEGVKQLQDMEADGWESRYLTGRREDTRAATLRWMAAHPELPYPTAAGAHELRMRKWSEAGFGVNKLPLADYKLAVIQNLIATEKPERVVLFDDDPEVIRLVQETLGTVFAQHCTWYIKEKALVTEATA
jgi:FMN phosphatase YigB (HAD superfamily)